MADREVAGAWKIEEIPDPDSLYMRVWWKHWDGGAIATAAIRDLPNKGDGMSTNWDKYSTADDVRSGRKCKREYGAVSFIVGEVRVISRETSVVHAPETDNRSHTLIHGPKDSETRVLYKRCLRVCIEPPAVSDGDAAGAVRR